MLIEAGVHGIFPLGTNGEFYAFNNDEKYEIIKTAVEAVNGRVPVYAGILYKSIGISTAFATALK